MIFKNLYWPAGHGWKTITQPGIYQVRFIWNIYFFRSAISLPQILTHSFSPKKVIKWARKNNESELIFVNTNFPRGRKPGSKFRANVAFAPRDCFIFVHGITSFFCPRDCFTFLSMGLLHFYPRDYFIFLPQGLPHFLPTGLLHFCTRDYFIFTHGIASFFAPGIASFFAHWITSFYDQHDTTKNVNYKLDFLLILPKICQP